MNIGFVGVGRMGANMARRLKDRSATRPRGRTRHCEPFHVSARQDVAVFRELLLRLAGQNGSSRWIDQQLIRDLRGATIPRHQRDHGRERAAGAGAADRNPRAIDVYRMRMVG